MTSGVLMANPDISTLWNIRKEVLEKSLKELDDKPKEYDQVLQKELTLTISCLQDNPKGGTCEESGTQTLGCVKI